MFSTAPVKYYLTLVVLLFAVHTTVRVNAQSMNGLGISTHYGFIYAHSEHVKNTSAARPFIFQVEFDNQLTDSATWDKCHCMPHQGILFNNTHFGLPLLGSAVNVAYYLQPSYFVGKGIEVGYRATTGLSLSSNPYDADNNPTNQSYSSRVNVYLAFGVHANFKLTSHINLTTSVQYNHISNGGLIKPNKGVNWPTAGIGLFYRVEPLVVPSYKGYVKKKDHKHMRYDLIGYYSSPMVSAVQTESYPVTGTEIKAAYSGRLHGWTAGAEFTKDLSYVQFALQAEEPEEGVKPYLAGALVGHEFILGKFIFSQQLGRYLYKGGNFYPSIYHRWGIVYYPFQNFGVGLNLKVHKETANFIDVRLAYSINR